MWGMFDGVMIASGFGVLGVENLRFLMEKFKRDEYEALMGV